MPEPFDDIDLRILAALQDEGRISNADLAGRVGLSGGTERKQAHPGSPSVGYSGAIGSHGEIPAGQSTVSRSSSSAMARAVFRPCS